jgi:serine/threonine protein kinase
MIIAINSIHTDGIVHMDLKEANIFVREGVWFVGDFGSCVNHGDLILEKTGGCYLRKAHELIGSPACWHHVWFAMALVIVNLVLYEYKKMRKTVTQFGAMQYKSEYNNYFRKFST